jgi:hypothetical protein
VTTQPDTDAPPTDHEHSYSTVYEVGWPDSLEVCGCGHTLTATLRPSDAPQEGRPTTPQTEAAIDRVAVGLDCAACFHRPHGADSRPGIDVRCGDIIDTAWTASGAEPVHCECLDYSEVYKAHQRLLHEARREAAAGALPSVDVRTMAEAYANVMGHLHPPMIRDWEQIAREYARLAAAPPEASER